MGNIEIASSTLDSAVTPYPADAYLFNGYSEHMVAEGVSWRERQMRLSIAKQFLHWWQGQNRREWNQIFSVASHCPNNHATEWEVRETYLHSACPDHDLRVIERANLIPFLRYLSLSNSLVG